MSSLPRQVEQEVSWVDSKGNTKTAWKNWLDDGGKNAHTGKGRNPNLDTAWNHASNNRKAILSILSIPTRPLDPLVLLMRFSITNLSRGVVLKTRSIGLLGL